MKRACTVLVALLFVLASAPAFAADVITGVAPSVPKIEVGKKFSVTVQGNLGAFTTCRVYLMLNTDQGTTRNIDATKFPITFDDVAFDKPGPGPNSTAFIHVWTGTSGPNPCGGQSFPAATVTAYAKGGPVITKVTPAAAEVKVGQKLNVKVEGVLGGYPACRVYYMLNTDNANTKHVDVTEASNFPRTIEVTFDKVGPGPNHMAWIHTWTGTTGDLACDGLSKDATVKVSPALIRMQPLAPSRSPAVPR